MKYENHRYYIDDFNPSDDKIFPEKITEMNIEISEYDEDFASLEFEEDLTEKTMIYIEKEVRGFIWI